MTRRRLKFVAGGLLVVGLLVAVFIVWSFSGSQAKINNGVNNPQIESTGPKQYKGKYISFEYLGVYQAQTLTARDDDLELATLTANVNYEKRLAVSVSRLANGSLNTNSAYLLRRSQPDKYSQLQIATAPAGAEVWQRQDNTEITAFMPHADKVAVLSFSAIGSTDDLRAEVADVLASFNWK